MNYINKKFGKLLIIEKVGQHSKKGYLYKCLCDCGTYKILNSSNLGLNGTKSCGCLKKEHAKNLALQNATKSRKGKESSYKYLYRIYKQNALSRNLIFSINETVFKILIHLPCFYCGIKNSNSTNASLTLKGQFRGSFNRSNLNLEYAKTLTIFHNGIDRKDPSIGYVEFNCVSCCGECNMSKQCMTSEEFLNKIKHIYEYQQSKNN